MQQQKSCLNYNHGRSNAVVRFCPTCGEIVNTAISRKSCGSDEHATRRRQGDSFCVDCGQSLSQPD